MNKAISLNLARQRLADTVAKHQPPIPAPLTISPWIAMSLLQKAIRRRREDLALSAAATLVKISPERLWRRCGGIAFEDIGVADLETLSLVTAALAGKRFRATMGGEWAVASCIVSKMARAPKCRTADDLLMSCELHPVYERLRRDMATMRTIDLLRIATGTEALPERALALRYAVGTDPRSRHLRLRLGEPEPAFDALAQSGYASEVVEIGREGFRKTREALCALVVLLSDQGHDIGKIANDEMPPEAMLGNVPGWAYDQYSREGRRALGAFLEGSSDTARWVRAHLPQSKRVGFLGGIVFRAEGGLCRNRLRWQTADELRRLVDYECHGAHCPDATEVLQLMRNDIGLLNEVRAHVC
jgi:hypothetical protein